MFGRTQITADRGGIASGRDTIVGIPPDQLPGIVEAATRDWKHLSDDQRGTIAALEDKLQVSEGALRAFFRTLGEAGVPLEQLEPRLVEIAENYSQLLTQVAIAPGDEPEVAQFKSEAKAALDAGEFEQADICLERVLAAQDARLERRQLEAAATAAQRGAIALTRLRYRDAAQHFAAAEGRVPAGNEEQALGYLDQEADALYRQGNEFGDNEALEMAIGRYRTLLRRRPRERVPLDWAATQNNLGNALWKLGERESGTGRLEESVSAHRAALEERTRERVPLDWATTQNNLGNALSTLGERESGTGRLEEAVSAHRAALEELTRERVPLVWAKTRNNQGLALWRLGERTEGVDLVIQARESIGAAHRLFAEAGYD
jgi:tetratricopeptide (TPR) repeat protein